MSLPKAHFVMGLIVALCSVASSTRPYSMGNDSSLATIDESEWVVDYLERNYFKKCYMGQPYMTFKSCQQGARKACIYERGEECKSFTKVSIKKKDKDLNKYFGKGCSLKINETGNYLFLKKKGKTVDATFGIYHLVCSVNLKEDALFMMNKVNGVRQSNDLPSVEMDPRLSRAAFKWARYSLDATIEQRVSDEGFDVNYLVNNTLGPFQDEEKSDWSLAKVFRHWMKNKDRQGQDASNIKSDQVSRVGFSVWRRRMGPETRPLRVEWKLVLADEK